MTTTTTEAPPRTWQISNEARAILERFPPRPAVTSWPMTRQSRAAAEDRLAQAPFRADDSQTRFLRNRSLQAVPTLAPPGRNPHLTVILCAACFSTGRRCREMDRRNRRRTCES